MSWNWYKSELDFHRDELSIQHLVALASYLEGEEEGEGEKTETATEEVVDAPSSSFFVDGQTSSSSATRRQKCLPPPLLQAIAALAVPIRPGTYFLHRQRQGMMSPGPRAKGEEIRIPRYCSTYRHFIEGQRFIAGYDSEEELRRTQRTTRVGIVPADDDDDDGAITALVGFFVARAHTSDAGITISVVARTHAAAMRRDLYATAELKRLHFDGSWMETLRDTAAMSRFLGRFLVRRPWCIEPPHALLEYAIKTPLSKPECQKSRVLLFDHFAERVSNGKLLSALVVHMQDRQDEFMIQLLVEHIVRAYRRMRECGMVHLLPQLVVEKVDMYMTAWPQFVASARTTRAGVEE